MLLGCQVLVVQEDDLMDHQRLVEDLKKLVVDRFAEIDAPDLGTNRGRHRLYGDLPPPLPWRRGEMHTH